MIGYIKGTVEGIQQDSLIIENGGIGYQIYTSGMTMTQIGGLHESVQLYTYMHVREDDLSLFGFLTTKELDTFKLLISVNGIGPKAALSILSILSVNDLAIAIMSGDAKAITKANGVGAKGANRVIMELKDKLSIDDIYGSDEVGSNNSIIASDANNNIQDTILALVSLGYSESEALQAVKKVPKADELNSEDLLKQALKHIF